MANVLFKRGLQSNLPASGSAVDGALYFTTDTQRLFLGLEDKTLIPIAEGISKVTSATELPAAASHEGEFYYIIPTTAQGDSVGNILAYSDGSKWLQVNMSTHISTISEAVADSGTVTLTIEESTGARKTASFQVVGSGNITVGKDADGHLLLTVPADKDTTYTLGTAAVNDDKDVKINLISSDEDDEDSSITLKSSSTVTVTRGDDGSISFGVDTSNVGAVSGVKIIKGTGAITGNDDTPASTNGFSVQVATSNGQKLYGQVDPTIKYGSGAAQEVHFTDGTATLSVPTISEVENLINDLEKNINAMKYEGVVSSLAALQGKEAHNGDVYLADSTFTIPAASVANSDSDVTVKPGYLIIVQGTETDGVVAAPTYAVVEGNDTDTQYQVETKSHGIQIKSGNAVVGEIGLAAGTSIDLTDATTGNKSNTITVAHADVTRSDPTATTTTQTENGTTAAFTVVTGVTTNDQGHVTGVATTNLTLKDTHADLGKFVTAVTAADNTATVKVESDGTEKKAIQFKVASDSLTVTKPASASDTVQVDLVWGTF